MSFLNSRFLLSFPFPVIVLLSSYAPRYETGPRAETQPVRVAGVSTASGSDRAFTGVVTARAQSDLGFRVSGKVSDRLVDTGQAVRVGQPPTLDGSNGTSALEVPLASVFDPGSVSGVWIQDRQKSLVTFRKVHLLQVGVETATITDGVRVVSS